MKYWLLTTEYPPFFGGGISTYCYFTAQMLAEKDHAVTVFVNDPSVADIVTEQKERIRVVRFNPARTASDGFLGHVANISFEFAHVVRHFIEQEGAPDVIEAQEYLGIAYYLLQFKHLQYEWCKDIPVVITLHSPSFLYMEYNHVSEYRYPNYWICEMERFCLQAADLLLSPSKFILDQLKKRFVLTNAEVRIIPNPYGVKGDVEPENVANAPDQIVFYGKLTVQKGAFKLLQYFKDLWDGGFSEPLYLVGGQDIVYHPEGKTMGDIIRAKYKSYIDKGLLRLENRIKPSEIKTRLAAAKVVIIPSANDNLPYVLFEMLELGKLVLVSRQGGHAEVVEPGVDGFVFDHHQPETFAQQLNTILQLSGLERQRISANAVRKVSGHYDFEHIYPQKLEALETVVRQRQPSACFPFTRSWAPLPGPQAVEASVTQGLLSVIVPYYNMGKYIDDTIRSLENADYALKEILIINDGSTDPQSLEKLEAFRGRENIRVFDTPNRGLAHARNYGAAQAAGEFLAFLDADDVVEPDYYSKAIRVLAHYTNVHFVGCWTRYFEGSTKIWPTFNPEPPILLFHNTVNSSALVYKRAAFLAKGLNDGNMVFTGLEDYESVVALTAAGFRGVVLPEPLFRYRVRKDSMIRAVSKNKKLLLYQYISHKHKEFYASFAAELFNLVITNGSGVSLDNPTLDYHLADKIPLNSEVSRKLIALIKKNKYAKRAAYRLYRLINK
ncbi:MAG TPA: glycosyltransferase [Chitinophagaceae bacterium]